MYRVRGRHGGRRLDPRLQPGCGPTDHDLDCGDAVPTVSTSGLVILAVLLLFAMKVYFGRPRSLG